MQIRLHKHARDHGEEAGEYGEGAEAHHKTVQRDDGEVKRVSDHQSRHQKGNGGSRLRSDQEKDEGDERSDRQQVSYIAKENENDGRDMLSKNEALGDENHPSKFPLHLWYHSLVVQSRIV
ncbi:hypothetical protein BC830DRAFT_267640 [Chytriomyces sp. MP71]|nr:hypothetical protein BC830DRAFT_267640 [Chytriomyces sp. MP71]